MVRIPSALHGPARREMMDPGLSITQRVHFASNLILKFPTAYYHNPLHAGLISPQENEKREEKQTCYSTTLHRPLLQPYACMFSRKTKSLACNPPNSAPAPALGWFHPGYGTLPVRCIFDPRFIPHSVYISLLGHGTFHRVIA